MKNIMKKINDTCDEITKEVNDIYKIKYVEQFAFYPVKGAPADTIPPKRKTFNSAGYDFVLPRDVIIRSHSCSKLVFTNIKAKMPTGYYLALFIRSSLAIKHNIMLINNVGVIDADYYDNPDNDGNIGIKLYNCGDSDVLLRKGERVMQGIFTKYYITGDDDADQLRTGGIGSTGK